MQHHVPKNYLQIRQMVELKYHLLALSGDYTNISQTMSVVSRQYSASQLLFLNIMPRRDEIL